MSEGNLMFLDIKDERTFEIIKTLFEDFTKQRIFLYVKGEENTELCLRPLNFS